MEKIFKSKTELIIMTFFVLIISCTNEFDYGNLQNAVKTDDFFDVTQTTVSVSGNVLTDNGSNLTARGICYGIDYNPTILGQKKIYSNSTLGNYTCMIDNLSPSTTYFARAYATNSDGTAYGKSISFTTLQATIPIISLTTEANLITATTVKTGGIITNSGASAVTSRGVCYSNTITSPTIANTKTNDGTGIGTFVSSLTGLTPNTTYYIRAYATNAIGTAYGDIKSFTTTSATIATGLTTTAISIITQTSANSGGNIAGDGGATITSRGVCWSNTTSSPTTSNSKTTDGNGIGTFSSNMTSLLPGTTYYVRAYATNSAGTAYGSTKTFTTLYPTIPTGMTTNSVSNIMQTTATSGGNSTGDGGASITSRGVCWSNTTSSPSINNSKTIDGSGIGSFTSNLTSLLPGTTYYVRAYATNSAGTAYGTAKIFTTSSATIPTGITTFNSSSISQNTATNGGSIATDGGSSITSRGVCWSTTTTSPTIANSKTINGSGTGSFSSSLTGLNPNTTYYVRAYATNNIGTAYGNSTSFTTLPNLSVGQPYQGGIIAYIYVSGDSGYVAGQTHGLIATTSNQSSSAQWGCSGTSINGTSTSFGTGLSSTTAIVNGCTSTTIAAAICNNLSSGGFSDWYLPSRDELYKLYLNRSAIGGFNNASYWSASQATATTSWSVNFSSDGSNNTGPKSSLLSVRAIRKF
ncbi:DUF1566 domain-containing protein [Flavobacterium gelidilacus]|uniref:Lcl domain-containing protein n=1 Tax=Flavobacterium gelidilacus TaxID=206041 RepID=UPI000425CF10|nr:DUF1566 domain-containing protein [Flavobacterium gelidilacus]